MRVRLDSRPRTRRGAVVTPFLLILMPLLLVAFLMAVQAANLRHQQMELRNAADAAALATANALQNDLLLTDDPERLSKVLELARRAGHHYAELNFFNGAPLRLEPNAENFNNGELILGSIAHSRSLFFDTILPATADPYANPVNAVQVRAQRAKVQLAVTAYADRDVVGFKIQGSQSVPGGAVPCIPVLPLAVLTDPCPPAENNPSCWSQKHEKSWERQILNREGTDDWWLDPATGAPRHREQKPEDKEFGDRIPEIAVTFRIPDAGAENGRVALFGNPETATVDDLIRQIETGVTAADLEVRQGRVELGEANVLRLPKGELPPQGDNNSGDTLAEALLAIIGQARIWMLYSDHNTQNANELQVVGFVAARVMHVARQSANGKTVSVTVTLQPATLITATALTDAGRRDLGERTILNPYVCKIRVVE